MWRARFGRGFGPVVRQTTKLNEHRNKLSTATELLTHTRVSPCWQPKLGFSQHKFMKPTPTLAPSIFVSLLLGLCFRHQVERIPSDFTKPADLVPQTLLLAKLDKYTLLYCLRKPASWVTCPTGCHTNQLLIGTFFALYSVSRCATRINFGTTPFQHSQYSQV
jgi:hypothetical protein